MIKDYKKALVVLNEYIKIKPNSKKLSYQIALTLDKSGYSDSAKVYYKKILNDFHTYKSKNDSITRSMNFTFLIFGHDSVMQALSLLKQRNPNNELIPSLINYYDKLSREYYVSMSLDGGDFILR